MTKKYSGFTLVETLVVIAIIATLTAVLVPSFSTFIKKAERTRDGLLIQDLNKALDLDCLDKGIERHDTMYQANLAVREYGLVVENLVSKQGYNIAWESSSDRYVLIDEENDLVVYKDEDTSEYSTMYDGHKKVDYFVVRDSMPNEDNGYSIYATRDWQAGDYTVNVGFDVGENEDLTSLTYNNIGYKQDVIIRTGGNCQLNINGYVDIDGTGDDIIHYGQSGKQVISCAYASFIEKGGSTYVEVTKGHYIQANGSIVAYLVASATDGDVVIDLQSGCITGTVTNNNDKNTVKIRNDVGAFVVNVEVRNKKGLLYVDFKEAPLYANIVDGEYKDGKEFSMHIDGIGNKGKNQSLIPFSNHVCYNSKTKQYEHDYRTVENLDIRVCAKCGGFEYQTITTTDGNEKEKSVQVNFNQYENNGKESIRTPIEEEQSSDSKHVHNFSEWIVISVANCESDGAEYRYCLDCGAKRYRTTKALGHDYDKETGKCKREGCNKVKEKDPHVHNYATKVKDENASCEGDGILIMQCSCGDKQVTIREHLGHNFVNGKCTRCQLEHVCLHTNRTSTVINEPTCIKTGFKKLVCDQCGDVIYEVIDKIGHEYVNDVCRYCGDVKTCSHNWVETVVFEPTCTSDGYKKLECSKCKLVNFEKYGDMKDHNPKDGSEPCEVCGNHIDCSHTFGTKSEVDGKPGLFKEVCSKCDYVRYSKNECQHTNITTTYEYSKKVKGKTETKLYNTLESLQNNITKNSKFTVICTCDDCGMKYSYEGSTNKNNDIDTSHSHSLNESKADCTCIQDGYSYKSCTCGYYEITVTTGGHKMVSGKCSVCGAHQHDFEIVTSECVAATAQTNGLKVEKCKHCEKKKYTVIEKTGSITPPSVHKHNFVYQSKQDADCIHDGYKTYKCSSCSEVQYEVINKLNHNFVKGVCSRCGAIQAHKHDYKPATGLEQTCINNGYCVEECSICHDKIYTVIVADNQHHHFVDGICQYCGAKENETHVCTYVKDEQLSCNPTCTSDGLLYEKCSGCTNVKATAIAALNHNFSETRSESVYKAVTCLQDGYEIYNCLNEGCNEYRKVTIKASGHDWSNSFTSDNAYTHSKTCKNCKEVKTEAHQIVVTYSDKYQISACQICGYNKSDLYVCSVANKKYLSIQDAIADSKGNGEYVITVLVDFTCANDTDIVNNKHKNTFTLDLNGHTITLADGKQIIVNQNDLTISDSSEEGNGAIIGNTASEVIKVASGKKLIVRSCLVENKNLKGKVVTLESKAALYMIGGHIKNNAVGNKKTTAAIYCDVDDANIYIYDGIVENLKGYSAIYSLNSKVVLDGGNIYGGNYCLAGNNINVSQYSDLMCKGMCIFDPNLTGSGYKICGGIYSTEVYSYIPEDSAYECVASEGWYIVRLKETVVESDEAIVIYKEKGNDVIAFKGTLASAVRYANDNRGKNSHPTVRLLKDVTASGIVLNIKMTIDLDGHTITSDATSDDGFVFMIYHDNKNVANSLGSTICDGKIIANKGNSIRVINHGKDKNINTVTKKLTIVTSSVNLKNSKNTGNLKIELSVGDFTSVEKADHDNVVITSGTFSFNPIKYVPGGASKSFNPSKDGEKIVVGDYIVIYKTNKNKSWYIVRSY